MAARGRPSAGQAPWFGHQRTPPKPAHLGPTTDEGPRTDAGLRTKAQGLSFCTSLGPPIDRRAIGGHQILLRRLLNLRGRHFVEVRENGVDAVRVVVVERERREKIRPAEPGNAAAL